MNYDFFDDPEPTHKPPETLNRDDVSEWTLRLANEISPALPLTNEALWAILERYRLEAILTAALEGDNVR